jgi:tetratricopeptide (TPR) repeat protein/ribosomal protein L40E
MSKTYQTCLECGARLAADAEQCDLCGSPVAPSEAAAAPIPTEAAVESVEPVPAPDAAEADVAEADVAEAVEPAAPVERPALPHGIYCNQCGWKNPVGARFCSMCGSPLQAVDPSLLPGTPSPAPPPPKAPASAPPVPVAPPEQPSSSSARDVQASADHQTISRQVGIIVGAGVLLVVVLFLVTAVSKTPLDAQVAAQVEALEGEIEQLSGEARLAKQRELVVVLAGAARLDRAALAQQEVAEATNAPDDWKRAGDLFYDWMDPLQGAEKARIAGQAVNAYQRVLEADPDNLDVRTDMATAYLSSNQPMEGVAEIKRVLEADPNHLHARFNYGIMLAMIGRTEVAIEQFELVKSQVDETSSYYQQADDAIRALQAGGSL